jgi:hypothetical protein
VAKKLTVVSPAPAADPDPIPSQLGTYGRQLWQSIQAEFGIRDAGGIALLTLACEAQDRAQRCRLLIDEQGELLPCNGGGVKENPLLRPELANRALIARTLARLGVIDEPTAKVGRPAKLYGSAWAR